MLTLIIIFILLALGGYEAVIGLLQLLGIQDSHHSD